MKEGSAPSTFLRRAPSGSRVPTRTCGVELVSERTSSVRECSSRRSCAPSFNHPRWRVAAGAAARGLTWAELAVRVTAPGPDRAVASRRDAVGGSRRENLPVGCRADLGRSGVKGPAWTSIGSGATHEDARMLAEQNEQQAFPLLQGEVEIPEEQRSPSRPLSASSLQDHSRSSALNCKSELHG